MKALFAFFLFINFMFSALAVEKEQRLEAAYAAIGAYIVEQKADSAKESIELKDGISRNIPGNTQLNLYYLGNYESYFGSKSDEKLSKELVKIGKDYIEKIIQKLAKPLCEKFKICKLNCYLDVAGDLIDFILISHPEFFILKSALQTYIVDGGMKYLKQACNC